MNDEEQTIKNQMISPSSLAQIANDEIINKICKMIVTSEEELKIFSDKVENKQDINRIQKEKQFVKATRFKSFVYREPPMPRNSRSVVDNREENNLRVHEAKQFVRNVKQKKKEHEGKLLMLKRAQLQRARQTNKKKEIEVILAKEIMLKARRLRAEKNIQFFNNKKLISIKDHRAQLANNFKDCEGQTQNFSKRQSDPSQERIMSPDRFSLDLESIEEQQNENFHNNDKNYQGNRKISLQPISRKRACTQVQPTRFFESEIEISQGEAEYIEEQTQSKRNYSPHRKITNSKISSNDCHESQSLNLQLRKKMTEISIDQEGQSLASQLKSSKVKNMSTSKATKGQEQFEKKYYHMKRNRTQDYSDYMDQSINPYQPGSMRSRFYDRPQHFSIHTMEKSKSYKKQKQTKHLKSGVSKDDEESIQQMSPIKLPSVHSNFQKHKRIKTLSYCN